MKVSHVGRGVMVALIAAGLSAAALFAQSTSGGQAQTYEPRVGQAGKDVVWVPTPQALVDRMLDMAGVTAADYVIDLGSGDGRTVITAAKRGARAVGIEYNPDMVALSQKNAAAEGVTGKATFMKADIFESDFSQATVITMFLLPDLNIKLRPKLLEMKPGTRIVSNSFTMGDWDEDERATVTENCTSYCTAYLWIIPARVAGRWQLGSDTLTLTQTYQMLSGTLGSAPIADAKMNGNGITFRVGDTTYTGQLEGNAALAGTRSGGTNGPWRATRQ